MSSSGSNAQQALKMDYEFDDIRNVLNYRKNYGFSNWDETFTHDSQDRLTVITGATNRAHSYDDSGRIVENLYMGAYNYLADKFYQLKDIELNDRGDLHYQRNKLQQVEYNAYRKPIEIYEEGKDRVSYEFNPLMQRSHAYYGGLDEDKTNRRYHKQYSSIMPAEIIWDNSSGDSKIITFVGGDAYSASISGIEDSFPGKPNGFHYLHRDYLGSILSISDEEGDVVEERQFGAWGMVDGFRSDNISVAELGSDSIIDRGFTGHEHLSAVGLIHMNGRVHDPNLGRFLSVDNYIQDMYNSQNFNRYGYALNNPLMIIDPSGEIAFGAFVVIVAKAAIIGAAVAGGSYLLQAAFTGHFDWGDFGIAVLGGALSGAAGGAIGALTGAVSANMTVATMFKNVGMGIASGILPAFNVPLGDFSVSVSPSIMFGTSAIALGGTFTMSYTNGDFRFAYGVGMSGVAKSHGSNTSGWEYRQSWKVNYDDGEFGVGLYSTSFSGYDGKFDQRVGGISLRHGDWGLRYENDGNPFKKGIIADGEDRFRSAAMEFTYLEWSAGFKIYTGKRIYQDSDAVEGQKGILGFINRVLSKVPVGMPGGWGANLPHGEVLEIGPKYRMGAAYIGYREIQVGVGSYRYIGRPIQNIFAHHYWSQQPGFTVTSDNIDSYIQYQSRNEVTLW